MKPRRTPEGRARNPSVVIREAPDVCRACAPLLANEQRYHSEAFSALAVSFDQQNERLAELRRTDSVIAFRAKSRAWFRVVAP